jgi:uncharacterized protein (TIGR03437 family)
VLYVTGLGAAPPAVSIDGAPAPVFYAGLAPGYVGLYQVNALLPSSAGATFQVVLEDAGRRSNTFVWNNPDAR